MKCKLFLAEGFEELEAVTLINLLRRAEFQVDTVSISDKREVAGSKGITIVADRVFAKENFSDTDFILLPGGMPGVKNLSEKKELLSLIKDFNDKKKHIGAICAAPYVLECAGILKGRKATSYPGWKEKMPSASYSEDAVVVDGNIITSRGVGTAIDMALKIVDIVKGAESKEKLKKEIVYK
ncbi:MAG TPA: DJ-1/PfpI family protein [Spirochaetota bacterium]|jgi:4-methyl-5(b-hydroxyethyl)-thiazole monophosphate biosynthesis|nr:MAG: Chaperone protein YajL [Spirochaetes bacterium ADurb.Bin133]HNZ27102.1 DJ-1/PfpI family protein [Spirochaetota bacterium]HPY88491.1 DJ-1/PfpI family protein [Spirochaetota bacterium]HQB60337.1 DJ-1/PfpI family protein [Spirochaetota bacterium]